MNPREVSGRAVLREVFEGLCVSPEKHINFKYPIVSEILYDDSRFLSDVIYESCDLIVVSSNLWAVMIGCIDFVFDHNIAVVKIPRHFYDRNDEIEECVRKTVKGDNYLLNSLMVLRKDGVIYPDGYLNGIRKMPVLVQHDDLGDINNCHMLQTNDLINTYREVLSAS